MECSVGEWGMVLKTYTSKRLKRGYFETGEQAGFAAARLALDDQSPSRGQLLLQTFSLVVIDTANEGISEKEFESQ